MAEEIEYRVTQPLPDEDLNPLYAAAWPNHSDAAFGHVLERSLAWVAAYERGELVGFVYVAWDGGAHAFLLEPTVLPEYQYRGIGTELIREAAREAADAGAEWLHVDYGPGLERFYTASGFQPSKAGVRRLERSSDDD